jgi:hypothetical protein
LSTLILENPVEHFITGKITGLLVPHISVINDEQVVGLPEDQVHLESLLENFHHSTALSVAPTANPSRKHASSMGFFVQNGV